MNRTAGVLGRQLSSHLSDQASPGLWGSLVVVNVATGFFWKYERRNRFQRQFWGVKSQQNFATACFDFFLFWLPFYCRKLISRKPLLKGNCPNLHFCQYQINKYLTFRLPAVGMRTKAVVLSLFVKVERQFLHIATRPVKPERKNKNKGKFYGFDNCSVCKVWSDWKLYSNHNFMMYDQDFKLPI